LQRLEQALGGRGCPGCRHRSWQVVVVRDVQLPDGTVIEGEEPVPCSLCGRMPEQIIRNVDPLKVLGLTG
jgi:hypothetical protein